MQGRNLELVDVSFDQSTMNQRFRHHAVSDDE